MKQEFIQALINKSVEKAITTRFPLLKSDTPDPEEIKRSIKRLERDGMLSILKQTEQDPEELRQMLLKATDSALETFKARIVSITEAILTEVKKEISK